MNYIVFLVRLLRQIVEWIQMHLQNRAWQKSCRIAQTIVRNATSASTIQQKALLHKFADALQEANFTKSQSLVNIFTYADPTRSFTGFHASFLSKNYMQVNFRGKQRLIFDDIMSFFDSIDPTPRLVAIAMAMHNLPREVVVDMLHKNEQIPPGWYEWSVIEWPTFM